MSFQDNTIQQYMDLLSARKSAPGGGSALALTLETAASLGQMVCNFTIGKKGYEHLEEKMKSYFNLLESVKKAAASLMDKDAIAFSKLMEAFKAKDENALTKAAYEAARVPFVLFKETENCLMIVRELAKIGNKNVVSDAVIAVDLCNSIFPGCRLNIEANLPFIKDENLKKKLAV